MEKSNNRLKYKAQAVEFTDDDYETPASILKDLLPFIKKYEIIYDPFYCSGAVIGEWDKLEKICLNEKKDAFNREPPEEFHITISNIPFSCKEKCVKLGLQLNHPFIFLMPIDALGSKWIKKYFDKLQFIIPSGRYNFLKQGKRTKGCWFDTMWVCYGLDLDRDIIKL